MEGLSKEKLKWMKEAGVEEFAKPMKYFQGMDHLFSEDYIKNTPLEILQERHGKRTLKNISRFSDGKEINR